MSTRIIILLGVTPCSLVGGTKSGDLLAPCSARKTKALNLSLLIINCPNIHEDYGC